MSSFPGFPDHVDEKASRVVAAGVGVTSVLAAGTGWLWLTLPLAYGFLARVVSGPTLSPLGQLAVRVVAPRLGPPRQVAGAPKRFAQGIGAAVTLGAAVAWAVGATTTATALLVLLAVVATLEAAFGFCVGCALFRALVRADVLPAGACEACADIAVRLRDDARAPVAT